MIPRPSSTTLFLPLVILATTAFSQGLLQTAPAPYLSIATTLVYLQRFPHPCSKRTFLPNLYLYLCIVAGTCIAYAGMLQRDVWVHSLVYVPFLFSLVIGLVHLIPLWVHLAWERRFLRRVNLGFMVEVGHDDVDGLLALASSLVGPTVWVAVSTALYALSPMGSYGSIAYTQVTLEPLVQWSSVAGISGIEFLVVWAAVFIAQEWTRFIQGYKTTSHNLSLESLHDPDTSNPWSRLGSPAPLRSPQPTTTTRPLPKSATTFWRLVLSPKPIFCLVYLIVFLYGSLRFWHANGTFYQRPLRDTILPTVKASCVIGSYRTGTMEEYWNQTRALADSGSEIVLWSETLVMINSTVMLDSFLNQARNISATFGIYLGVTYSQAVEDPALAIATTTKEPPTVRISKNKLTVLDPKGQIVLDYQKSHPVTMVETTVLPGPKILPTVDTEKLGRLGSAICFDMDFPRFIAQAGSKKVDLLLQPSWTWGSIGRLEATIQSFRAVEQGLTLFRCGSWAPSTVYDTYHQLFGYKELLGSGTFTVEIPLRRHVATVYSVVGDLWAFLCCALALGMGALLLVPRLWMDLWMARLENVFMSKKDTPQGDPEAESSSAAVLTP